jgi:hypothetical protein
METSRDPESVTISIPDSVHSSASSPPPPLSQPQQSQGHHFRFWLNQNEETSKSQPLHPYRRRPEEEVEFEDEIESEDSEENERHPSAPFNQHGGGRRIDRARIADGSGNGESEGGRIGNGPQARDKEGKRIRRRTDGGGSTISTLTVGDISNEEDMEAEKARERLPLRVRFVAFARCLVAEILGTFILTIIHGESLRSSSSLPAFLSNSLHTSVRFCIVQAEMQLHNIKGSSLKKVPTLFLLLLFLVFHIQFFSHFLRSSYRKWFRNYCTHLCFWRYIRRSLQPCNHSCSMSSPDSSNPHCSLLHPCPVFRGLDCRQLSSGLVR